MRELFQVIYGDPEANYPQYICWGYSEEDGAVGLYNLITPIGSKDAPYRYNISYPIPVRGTYIELNGTLALSNGVIILRNGMAKLYDGRIESGNFQVHIAEGTVVENLTDGTVTVVSRTNKAKS